MKKLLWILILMVSICMADEVLKYNVGHIKLVSSTPILNIYSADKDTSRIIDAIPSYNYLVTNSKMDTVLTKLKERDKFEIQLKKQGESDLKPWYLQDSFLYTVVFISGYLVGHNK